MNDVLMNDGKSSEKIFFHPINHVIPINLVSYHQAVNSLPTLLMDHPPNLHGTNQSRQIHNSMRICQIPAVRILAMHLGDVAE